MDSHIMALPFVFIKNVAVKKDLRFGETLSVVESACCALWIAQGRTMNIWVLCFTYYGVTVPSYKRESFIPPPAGRQEEEEAEEEEEEEVVFWKVVKKRRWWEGGVSLHLEISQTL